MLRLREAHVVDESRQQAAPVAPSKRLLDASVSLLLLILFSPVLALLSIAVRLTSPGPIIFRQVRVGRCGSHFVLYKFRTMRVDVDDSFHRKMVEAELKGATEVGTSDGVFKLENDPRVTGVGGWLRKTSLDELPQLWNVLRGDMSLVGPRPSLPWEADLFEPRFRERESTRPGITGLWQVSGRNRLSMTQMLELDLQYVRHLSLRTDLSILARTPLTVLRGDGAR